MKSRASLNEVISKAVRNKDGFDIDRFKLIKKLDKNVGFKPQEWIPWSAAMQDITSLVGAPHGHISLLRGHSDTGKTTLLLELATSTQKIGKLPVLIITEMKWNWEHAKEMGFEVIEEVQPDGEILYKGNFIYVDRGTLNTIEDIAHFINDLLDEQKKGNLPIDLVFLWDSIGSIPCKMSVDSNKNNNEWNAGAMSVQFGNFINQKIILSRKANQPYTNSLICINKVWVDKPENPMARPKMKNKNGNTMFFDSSVIVTFGNISNPGTSKIKAVKGGKEVEFAKRTKVQIDKNHVGNVTTKGTIIMTAHGFIKDDKKEIDQYKKDHSDEWLSILGGTDFEVVIENEETETSVDYLLDD